MSDSESKKHDKATKTFFPRVSERTRSKRDAYCEITYRTSSGSQNAVHSSGGISAPIASNERKRSVGKLWGYTSSCNNIGKSGVARASASQECTREHKRRKQVKPAASVGGNNSAQRNVKEPMIEIIGESESRNQNICSASEIRGSTTKGLNKGFYAAGSRKNVNISSKKPFATVKISSKNVSHRRLLVREENDNEDLDSEEIQIIDKDEFMSQNSCSMSKIGPSSKGKLKASIPAVTPKKDGGNLKMESSAGYCESFCPEDAFHDSDHASTHASRSFMDIGSNSDDKIHEDNEIKGIDEAGFRNQKKQFQSKIGRSTEQALCASCSCKNVGGAKKNILSADLSVTTGPDMLADNSRSLAKKVNSNELISCRKTKINGDGEGELKNGKSSTTLKRGAFVRQGYSAASSRKNADIVKELSSHSYCGSFSEHAGKDSHKEHADRSRLFTETVLSLVYSDEYADPEELGIEEVDESEFMKRKQFVMEKGSSTWQERNEGHFAATSAKNVIRVKETISFTENVDKNKRKRNVSSYSESKRKGEVVHVEVDSSTSESIDSYSSSEVNTDDFTNTLQDDEVSSCGAKHGMDTGVASRTRSKMGSKTKPAEVGNVSSSLSIDSDSSSSDSVSHSFNDEDFDVESSDHGIEILGSYAEAYDVLNNKLMKVSAEKDKDCSKEVGGEVELASDRSHSNLQSKESNCEQPALESQKFSSRKILLSDDASSKPEEGEKAHKTCEVQEEIDQTFNYVAEAEEGMKERNNLQKSTCSKQLYAENGCDEVNVVYKLHPEDQSQEGMRRPNKAAEEEAQKKCEVQEHKAIDQTFRLKERNNLLKSTRSKKSDTQKGCDGVNRVNELHPKDQSHVGMKRPKKAAEGKARKSCEVEGEREEIDQTLHVDADAETSLKEMNNLEKSTGLSLQKNGCDGMNGANELLLKEQSQTGMRKPNNAGVPSHSKNDHDQSDAGMERPKNAYIPSHLKNHNDQSDARMGILKKADLPSHLKNDYNQSDAAMGGSKKVDLPYHPKNDYDQSDDEDDDTQEKTEATSSVLAGRKQMPSEPYDLCSMLADVVLGRGQMPENDSVKGDKKNYEEFKQAPASQTQDTLPLKFRFEDEVPELVQETDYEKEIEGLFSDLDYNWAMDEIQAFDYPQVNLDNETSPAEETQHQRCSRGKHELVLEDDQGLICIFCHHVVLEAKDVMPEWAERTYQHSARKRYSETEQTLEFDELQLQSSIDNVADYNATGTVWSIKPGVRESMYKHQREGFEFLWKNLAGSINLEELRCTNPSRVGGCIISHAPGTGKSRLTIVFVETYLRMFPNCRPVIIGPASMLLTWEEEFRKWKVGYPFLNLNNSELSGKEKSAVGRLAPAKSRDMESIRMIKIFSWSMGGSILGISYSLFEKLTGVKHIKGKTNKKRESLDNNNKKMRQILLEKPGLVILDEGHTPRNQRSNIWNALLKLQTQKRVILSGTPFQNNFTELFNTLRIVRPAIADVLAQEKTYAEMVGSRRMSSSRKQKGHHSQSPLVGEVVDRAVDNLKFCMSPFVHVHKGTILQQSLPGLRDCVVLLKPPALQKSLIERIEGSNNFKVEHEIALISVHPYLYLHCESTEAQMTGIDMDAVGASKLNPQEGVKTRFVLELARLSVAVKEKVLVFSQYIQPLELIKEQLEQIFKWVDGKQILRMKGKIEQKQRQILINLFNDPNSESKIMLASTRCCSEGISLIGASRVVLLDVVWNPSVERQAISRAYRIGQKKFVYTYHLMTSGTTEADKYCRQAEKERLSELVFSSANEEKHLSLGMEDRILEVMVGHESFKGMFEKIINQPKDTDLIQTFGLPS